MPEGLEIEYYRRAADALIGERITAVAAPDPWYLKGETDAERVEAALRGTSVVATRRIGKLLLVDVARPRRGRRSDVSEVVTTLGVRFGMTGVLEVGGRPAIAKLQYSSERRDDGWIRFGLSFRSGTSLAVRDPRRLGGVELDPDLGHLGPDALTLTPAELRGALGASVAPLKARLMDQQRVAGLGNLLTDEILWRAGLDPARPAGGLTPNEQRRLHRHVRTTLDELADRGGSHTGDLMVARTPGASCPRCGAPIRRRTIGGRTTYSCPAHQR